MGLTIGDDLSDVIVQHIKTALADLFTSQIATVLSFDSATKTVDVQPVTDQPVPDDENPFEEDSEEPDPYPVVSCVPVAYLSGGGFAIDFPLAPGDTVLLVGLVYSATNWRLTGKQSAAGHTAQHHIAHCVAIPMRGADVDITPATDGTMTVSGPAIRANVPVIEVVSDSIYLGTTADDPLAKPVASAAKLDTVLATIAAAAGAAYTPGSVAFDKVWGK